MVLWLSVGGLLAIFGAFPETSPAGKTRSVHPKRQLERGKALWSAELLGWVDITGFQQQCMIGGTSLPASRGFVLALKA